MPSTVIPNFMELKEKIQNSAKRSTTEEEKNEVWEKIFTPDLKNVIELFSWQKNSIEVQFSLMRIYAHYFKKSPLGENHPNRTFEGKTLTGKTMLFNLLKCYIETFQDDKDDLFKEKNRFFQRNLRIDIKAYSIARTLFSTSSSTT